MFDNTFLKTLKILYIETDQNTNKHFSNILTKMFKSVNSFTKPDDAISYLNEKDILREDIVICDINLQSISGIQLLKLIKLKNKEIPFILTAGDVNADFMLEAIKLKVDDFLLKPVNAKDLIYAVEKICNEKFHNRLNLQSTKDLKEIEELIDNVALFTKTNKQGEISYVNKHFLETTKFEEDKVLNNTHSSILNDPSNNIDYKEINQALSENKKWEGKLKEFDKDKNEFYSYLTILPVENDETNEEFMWVRFLATDYEEEQNEFKKKVKKNIIESKRINNEARNKIDELQNRIVYYNSLDESLKHEYSRNEKFIKQINYYEGEIEELEEKLAKITNKASNKIKNVVALEKNTRLKRDNIVSHLKQLNNDLDIKNKDIKELTKELDNQKKMIKKLKLKIDNREYELGLND
jgi:FixJ family two-component response regulator